MAKRTLSHIAIIVGAALIIIAILLPTFLVPRLKVIPLDTVSTTITDQRDGALLDSGLIAKNEPVASLKNDPKCKVEEDAEGDGAPASLPLHCFINPAVPLQSNRHVHIEEPADKEVATFEVGTTILRGDKKEPENLVNATIDRITLDRSTAYPVEDPTSTVQISHDSQPGALDLREFTRPGIQYQFPFNAAKKNYPYYDVVGMLEQDIEFQAEEKQDGKTVYRYAMTIPPVNLYEQLKEFQTADGRRLTDSDKQQLASLRLKFPASVWGLEGDEDVEMDRYYTNTRIVRVEPTTGMIVNGTEHIFQYYAKDQAEADRIASQQGYEKEKANRERTAMDFEAQWSEETKKNQMNTAKESGRLLTIAGTVMPIILGIVGIVLLVLGIRGVRRS